MFLYIHHNILDNKFDLMNNIKVNDDKMTGDIVVSNNGYMALSIPYDCGFKVKVDDQLVDYEPVNNGFIGFKIDKGYHFIEVSYQNPYFNLGIISSIIGIISITILLAVLNVKSKKKSIDN